MAAQTNYNFSTPMGVPGGKVDISCDEVVSRMNEAEDGVLKFGMAVKVGSVAGSNVTIPATGTTAAQIEGVLLAHANTEQNMKGEVVIKKNATVGILTEGRVWGRLATGATATYGATAYVVVVGDDAGKFTNSAKTTVGEDQVDNVDISAKFGKYTEDGIAVIEL